MVFQNTTTVSYGLSYFQKLVLAVLKTNITKSKPQKISYRLQNLDLVKFNEEVKHVLAKMKITFCTKFYEISLQIFNKHALLKSKLLSSNHVSFISKRLIKAVIKRSYLKNLCFKERTEHS